MVWLLSFLIISSASKDSLARHYLEIGDPQKAEEFSNEIKDNFLLGEIAYFSHKFDEATKFYTQVPVNSLDANDAIFRIILIKENSGEVLQDYVTAELLGRQEKLVEGISILKKLHETTSPIAPYASMLLAEFWQQKEEPEKALEEYQRFINKFTKNENLPQVLLRMGEIYTTLGKPKKASEVYREILLKYPKSCVAPIARERMER